MTILLENVRLSYCHLTSPVVDKLSGKSVYKVRVDVPYTKEAYEKIVKEISDAKNYAAEHKIKDTLGRNGKVPNPQSVYDVQRKITEDGKWIYLDMSVAMPIQVYDRFGTAQQECEIRRANHADVQLFAYAWTHGTSWGVKLCPKAVCIKEDIEALMQKAEDPNSQDAGCQFKFEPKKKVTSALPF